MIGKHHRNIYTELKIQRILLREVDQERWISLDRTLQRLQAKGLSDELYNKGYLVVEGKAHYIALPTKIELMHCPVWTVVEVRA